MKKNINYILFLFIFIVYNNLYATKVEIVAKINNQIITNIDLEYRLNLAIEISNIPNEIKFRKQIRQQILNLLIDENLKIQEAEKLANNLIRNNQSIKKLLFLPKHWSLFTFKVPIVSCNYGFSKWNQEET